MEQKTYKEIEDAAVASVLRAIVEAEKFSTGKPLSQDGLLAGIIRSEIAAAVSATQSKIRNMIALMD